MGSKYKAMHEINRECPDKFPHKPNPADTSYWGLKWWELLVLLIVSAIMALLGR